MKTFYEVVRVKVSCKDPSKIPAERLYEMDRKLFVVDFEVKKEEDIGQTGNGGDNGGDDDKLDNDDDADDLSDDGNPEKTQTKQTQTGDKSKLKTPVNKPSSSSGCKTIPYSDTAVGVDQDRQLISLMGESEPKLLTAGGLRLLRAHHVSIL